MAEAKPSAFRPWREGVDEAVFIAFHPAYRLPGIDAESFYRKLDDARGWSARELDQQNTISKVFEPLPPDKAREFGNLSRWQNIAAKHERRLVGWREMQAALGIPEVRDFELVLRQATGNLATRVRSPHMDAFESYVAREGIFLPTDCEIQPSIETLIGTAFRNTGCESVSYSDEFLSYDAQMSVESLCQGPSILNLSDPMHKQPAALWSESAGLACYAEFDSVVTVFRGTLDAMRNSCVDTLLEGVWAASDDDPPRGFSWPENLWPGVDIWKAS